MDREFECRHCGLRLYRPSDYPLLPQCPACMEHVQPTSKWRKLLRKIVDYIS